MKSKKSIYVSLLLFFLLSGFQQKKEEQVYICVSVKSTRYHYKKNCRGLSGCKSEIKKISKKKAEKYGRILCKYESKKKK